ncbi:MAG TPA: aminopeptidase P N-terminal domain-containing protein [Mucilaginibacter sp.]|jgi:Xaa-Pro aminopeptidase|nr:aminopeptidase P N-terminal domain-containing protein [Mucilaginibacter sp.]
MKIFYKTLFVAAITFMVSLKSFSQTVSESLPTDYLTKEFHAGRRDALRKLMPDNSVAVIFAYPERVFSQDVNYVYHASPDLYYFSGYKETSAVLLIFKDMQHGQDGDYNELLFVQSRDPRLEQWTGKRLGVEGAKSKLGFSKVYNSEEFVNYAIDLKKFSAVLYGGIPENEGNMKSLYDAFKQKAAVPEINKDVQSTAGMIAQRGSPRNIGRIMTFFKAKFEQPEYKNSDLLGPFINKPDSASLAELKAKYDAQFGGLVAYSNSMDALRGVKQPEEVELVKKAVEISSIAHAEVMRAIKPAMSERELQGIFEYVHKKYGAEDEGYPPIVGAGANGCILHYEENNVTEVNNQLVLMDVGAEYHGYSADVTRTVPANGKFTEEQKAIYQLVYDAQEEVFKLCKEGVPYNKLEEKTQEVLANGLIKLGIIKNADQVRTYYPHGVSHHLGLDVHDKGVYGSNLKENMIITVEPGIYIPAGSKCDKKWWDIGVRIEDDVLIGKDNCTLLSIDAPRKWQDVEKTVADKSIFDLAKFPPLK